MIRNSLFLINVFLFFDVSFATAKKIDQDGVYQKFQGVTVIALASNTDQPFWKKIYQAILQNDELKQYYAPLPLNSYHMTTHNIFIRGKRSYSDWKNHIDKYKDEFQRLNQVLHASQLFPQAQIIDISMKNTLQITLRMDPSSEDKVHAIGTLFHLKEKIPHPFHVTLAYSFKECSDLVKDKIKQSLENVIKSYFSDDKKSLVFQSPQLCFFEDMQQFYPWSAQEFPFAKD